MYKKLILAAVLVAFVGVQLVNSLNCYHCDGVSNCRKPVQVGCSRENANKTRENLHKYFINIVNMTSDNFECFHTNYTQSNSLVMETAGCIYREQYPCQLSINPAIGSNWQKQDCNQCGGNLCNKTNPAGTYSTSFYTIIASMLSLVLAKIFSK